jgi:hypothetical protein
MYRRNGSCLYGSQLMRSSKQNMYQNLTNENIVSQKLSTDHSNLSIRGVAGSSDHFMKIIPIHNFTVLNVPYANLFIQ